MLSWEDVKSNRYAVFKNTSYNGMLDSEANMINTLINEKKFMDDIFEPLLIALKGLIETEEKSERMYMDALLQKLSPFMPKENKSLLELYLSEDNLDLSAAFNLLSSMEADITQSFSSYKDFLDNKKQEMALYSAKQWDEIIMSAIDRAWEKNDTLEEVVNEALYIASEEVFGKNPKAKLQTFLDTLEAFKRRFTPELLDFLGETDPTMLIQSLSKENNPYLLKKTKQDSKYANMPVNEILHNFAIGKMRGIMGELQKQGLGVFQTGQVKDKGRNIEADKIKLISFMTEINETAIEQLEQIKTKTELDQAIHDLFGSENYFRIEYSVKSSAGNAPKIKDAASFNARFQQLEVMGRQLHVESEVEDLLFILVNSVPGFIADATVVSPNDLARAVSTLGFAFMFDLSVPEVLDNAQQLVTTGIQERKVHIYDVNNIYYTASDVLKCLYDLIIKNKGNYLMISSTSKGSTINYNGLNAEVIWNALKEEDINDEQLRWEVVRNTIIGTSPRLGLNYATFGSWNFARGESNSGLRINFNQMLKQMGSLK